MYDMILLWFRMKLAPDGSLQLSHIYLLLTFVFYISFLFVNFVNCFIV